MGSQLTTNQISRLNDACPALDNASLGTWLNEMSQLAPRDPRYFRYVDSSVSSSGDGKSWANAFKTVTEGIAAINDLAGYRPTLFIAPAFYIEKASAIEEITANDWMIYTPYTPEGTVLFGSGTDGSVSASTEHLLRLKSANGIIKGLTLYNHVNTKSCIYIDTDAAATEGFGNIIDGVHFSPQAQDGFQYGITIAGGACNRIQNCFFEGAKDAGIYMYSNLNNPSRNTISGNIFRGTDNAVYINAACYDLLFEHNTCLIGDLSGEGMTNAIDATAGYSAGKTIVAHNYFEQADWATAVTNAGAGTFVNIDNSFPV